MRSEVLEPVGAIVRDVSVGDVAAETAADGEPGTAARLKMLLAEHGMLVLPDQDIDDTAFLDFLRQFGEMIFTTGETPVDGYPDLNVISNVGRKEPPRSTFHTDTSYLRRPPAYTALRAVRIPTRGGHTEFTNQYRAFETLPPGLQQSLAGRTITHVVTGLELGADDEQAAEHPILLEHPITGRTALFMSTPARCAAISGMSPQESERTVRMLFEHSTRPDNIRAHAWSAGDVVMWDNRCVLHRGDHSDVVGDRVMNRGMVLDREVPAPPLR